MRHGVERCATDSRELLTIERANRIAGIHRYKNGLPHGRWRRENARGRLLYDIGFKDGQPHGKWTIYASVRKNWNLPASAVFDHGERKTLWRDKKGPVAITSYDSWPQINAVRDVRLNDFRDASHWPL